MPFDLTNHSILPAAISADPLLIWNYCTMAVIAAISAVLLWLSVRKQDKKEREEALRGGKEIKQS